MKHRNAVSASRLWLCLLLGLAAAGSCGLLGCGPAAKPVELGSPTAAVMATLAPSEPPTLALTLPAEVPTLATLAPTGEPAPATQAPTEESGQASPTKLMLATLIPPKLPKPLPTLIKPLPKLTLVPSLAILSFTAAIADIPTGKRLTFEWTTTGATSCRIVSGSAQRFAPQWPVPANGTHTADLGDTYYPNPTMTLYASDGAGHEVAQSVTVDWPCKYTYFFSPAPSRCAAWEPSTTPAAEQPFEHGRMVWLSEMHFESGMLERQILVLYDDGQWEQHDDIWTEGMPESDPSIVPPAGLLQPVRGFGKVWRENASVRTKLGWATAAEVGYTASWQPQKCESVPAINYVSLTDGRVVEYAGQGAGTWEVVAP